MRIGETHWNLFRSQTQEIPRDETVVDQVSTVTGNHGPDEDDDEEDDDETQSGDEKVTDLTIDFQNLDMRKKSKCTPYHSCKAHETHVCREEKLHCQAREGFDQAISKRDRRFF